MSLVQAWQRNNHINDFAKEIVIYYSWKKKMKSEIFFFMAKVCYASKYVHSSRKASQQKNFHCLYSIVNPNERQQRRFIVLSVENSFSCCWSNPWHLFSISMTERCVACNQISDESLLQTPMSCTNRPYEPNQKSSVHRFMKIKYASGTCKFVNFSHVVGERERERETNAHFPDLNHASKCMPMNMHQPKSEWTQNGFFTLL